tara:strand:- start:7860 stop:8066 length:207 start_codon:yes stop_codon:yes gene_type:complete
MKKVTFSQLKAKMPNKYFLSYFLGELLKKQMIKNYEEENQCSLDEMLNDCMKKFLNLELSEEMKKRGS